MYCHAGPAPSNPTQPSPAQPRPPPARPIWRHFRSFGTPRPIPWIRFRYLFAPISIRSVPKISRLSEQSLQIVWTRLDSVNSVDIYIDMSELSKLYACQVYKYWTVESQNVNISKYLWPLDGIIICLTLVTLLFLYVFLPFVHLFLL